MQKDGVILAESRTERKAIGRFVGMASEQQHLDEHPYNNALIAAAPELLAACKVVKVFLDRLEDGTDVDDPLYGLRKRFHAPLRAALEPAIAKAERR